MKKLYRTEGDAAKLAGVCGGVAEYFAIDPTIVRLLAVLLCLGSLSALLSTTTCALNCSTASAAKTRSAA